MIVSGYTQEKNKNFLTKGSLLLNIRYRFTFWFLVASQRIYSLSLIKIFVIANNLRSCFVYSLDTNDVPLTDIVEKIKTEERLDMISWKIDEWIHVASGENIESFKFKEGGKIKDEFN